MNAFYEHHEHSIEFGLSVLRPDSAERTDSAVPAARTGDRLLQCYRDGRPVTHRALTEIADQFLYWVKNRSEKWGAPIVEAPEDRRDEFVEPYLKGQAGPRGRHLERHENRRAS